MQVIDNTGFSVTTTFGALSDGDAFEVSGTFYVRKNSSTGVRLDDLADITFDGSQVVKKRVATVTITMPA